MKKTSLTLQDIYEVKERIKPYIVHTPLLRARAMEDIFGCQVYLKPEMFQVSGAFKMRGALNRILLLSQEEKERGIICSSSGNHGKACATVGQMTGTRVVVVLPEDIQQKRREAIENLGAEVLLGADYRKRYQMVQEAVQKNGYTIVHPYEDYEVMAGQGTIGLEILEDLPEVDTIIVPVGGGGLIAGIATAVKEIRPNTKIIGVQSEASAPYVESFRVGHPVEVTSAPSLADGLTGAKPGINPYPIIEKYVDDLVSVTEADIRKAVKLVAEQAKLIAEPSSCVGIAAVLGGRYKARSDEKVCFVLTSGNWDIEAIGKILNDETLTMC